MPMGWNIVSSLWRRALREPVVHFFFVGALLFAGRHWLVGDPRTIVVPPGVEADLTRRFEDLQGRKPDAAELATELAQWKRDEALFREALRRGLDRDDPSIRSVLVDKMRALADAEVTDPTPTDAELEQFLEQHRSRYDKPRRYDFQFVRFPRSEGDAEATREQFRRALEGGAPAASLGRALLGAKLATEDMQGRIPAELAARIPDLLMGEWQIVDTARELLLIRVRKVEGGLPSLSELRPLLTAEWVLEQRKQAVDRILQRTADRYRFEERR